MKFLITNFIFLFLCSLFACAPTNPANQRYVDSAQNIFHLQDSVVSLFFRDAAGDLEGPICTAFFVSSNTLVTAGHCVNGIGYEVFEITPGVNFTVPIGDSDPVVGRTISFSDFAGYDFWVASGDPSKILVYNAEVIDISPEHDLAILEVETGYRAQNWISMRQGLPRLGEIVYTMAMPASQPWILSEGTIASIRRSTEDNYKIFHQAPIAPGASGSPLVDNYGLLVGVNVAYVKKASYLTIAVPVMYLQSIFDRSIK